MKKNRTILAFNGALSALALLACAPSVQAETHVVEMQGLEFVPATLDVAVGDTIVWINRDVAPHTATAGDGSWNSGLMEQGDEFSLLIEADTSTGDYACNFHPTMVGLISVE